MNGIANSSLAYLAVPYSHPDQSVRAKRFDIVNRWAHRLIQEGNHIFSPISHTHPIALVGDLPLGWEYWAEYDQIMLKASGRLIVLMIDGWKESVGVQAEIKIAQELGLKIEYIEVYEMSTDGGRTFEDGFTMHDVITKCGERNATSLIVRKGEYYMEVSLSDQIDYDEAMIQWLAKSVDREFSDRIRTA